MRRSAAFIGVLWVLATICDSQWVDGDSNHCKQLRSREFRPHSVTITEFGAVGDGVTLNTLAFQNAIFYLHSFSDKGGAQLFVPAGKWLTGSFSLISHLTLSLDKDAVIIGSVDPSDWPIIDPLPSYGRGRELPGGRHQSLIYGYNLTDVIITGGNGTIDGQGDPWWNLFRNKTLDYTRPHLVELMYSTEVIISNLTLMNSPFWAIHPVYCSHVLVQNVTILPPLDSPNTDGIDPDSSNNVCIEDCYIRTGDDLIAIKSGWDEYGVSFARPSSNISIQLFNSLHGIRIKTAPGRGGYVRNIHISDVVMTDVKIAIRITGQYGEHPDDNFDRDALPSVSKITISDLRVLKENFSSIQGYSSMVSPELCEPLRGIADSSSGCYTLNDVIPCKSSAQRLVSPLVKLVSF